MPATASTRRDTSSRRVRWVSLAVFGAVLLAGVAAASYRRVTRPAAVLLHARLETLLPRMPEQSGWSLELQPVADTPEMWQRVKTILNFDEGLCATYTRGGVRIAIYLAYWKPDRMAFDSVVGHTPAVCWVANGWCMDSQVLNPDLVLANGERMLPAQQFKMSFQGRQEDVLYWHVTSAVSRTARKEAAPWYARFAAESWEQHRGQEEQLVVRLSSSAPLEMWWNSAPVQQLLAQLPLRKRAEQSG